MDQHNNIDVVITKKKNVYSCKIIQFPKMKIESSSLEDLVLKIQQELRTIDEFKDCLFNLDTFYYRKGNNPLKTIKADVNSKSTKKENTKITGQDLWNF